MIDEINGEIDKRKLTKLVDDGVISKESLANASVVLECPNCKHEQDPHNDTCEDCGEDIT